MSEEKDKNRLNKLDGFFKNELNNNKDISVYEDNNKDITQEENKQETIKNADQNKSKEEIRKKAKPDKNNYKSMRLYPEDYEILREIGFFENMSLIEVVSEAINDYAARRKK